MKATKTFSLSVLTLISLVSTAQNVGIGNSAPKARLHITDTGSLGLMIENLNILGVGTDNAMYFTSAMDSSTPKYTGAIKTIGTGFNTARMSFFTFTGESSNILKERVTILDNGYMGIGNINPLSRLHISSLEDNGLVLENTSDLYEGSTNSIYFTSNIDNPNESAKYTGAIKSIGSGTNSARMGFYTFASNYPDGLIEGLTLTDNGHVGIGMISPTYKLDITGDLRASTNGIFGSNLTVGNNITITGNATVTNGLPVVASAGGGRTKMVATTITLNTSNLAANSLQGGIANLNIAGYGFTAAPSVYLGDVVNKNGDYYRASIFFESVTTSNVAIRVFNPTSSIISFTGASWKVLIVGPY